MDTLRVAKVERVVLERTTREPPHTRVHVEGTLHLTPHHLIFHPTSAASTSAASASVNTSANPNAGSISASDASGTSAPEAEAATEVWVPYPTINVLQRLTQAPSGRYPLLVGTKTFDTYTLLFERDREGGAEDVWQSIKGCAVAQSVEQLYAFYYSLPRSPVAPNREIKGDEVKADKGKVTENPLGHDPEPVTDADASASVSATTTAAPAPSSSPVQTSGTGWASYNPRAEFARQGVGSRTKAWRFTDINRDYTFSPTYPAKLVVPSRISDTLLGYAAKYRSKARIPALSYLHWANHASITRSSQPMIGIKNARSPQDERLVECIFSSHLSPDTAYSSTPSVYGATPTNLIIDARPTANAMANKAKGAGTENMDWYRSGKKQHLGIDNIHVMRSSLKAVCEALAEADASQLPVDSNKLRRSNWLKHTACILDGSVTIIRNVHIYSSHVLIHCSDGWDRTSQLSAIAQLCLDPYFRTLEGFKVLVEKDWLSFGHMFLQRSGHLSSDKLFTATPDNLDADEESDDEFGVAVKGVQAFFGSVSKQFQSNSHIKEVSPVFHQFLDCVRQIQRQFPDRFEFNEDYLIDLHYHLYACQFGTFMFDSERQRRTGAKPYTDRTVSAWEWFDLPAQRARYLHKGYRPELDDRTSRASDADLGVLLPDPRDVAFWHRLFKRSDEEMNPPESRFLDTAAGTPVAPEPPLLAAEDRMMSDDAVPSLSAVSASAASLASISTAASASGPASGTVSVSGSTGSTPALTPSATGRKQWNWSQLGNGLGTGALSAFNQFKASASDALTQLRESADAAAAGSVAGADEMSAREREREYAPGTGIGEGRGPSAGLPRTPLRVPSEANPWSDKPVSVSASAKKDKEEKGSEPPSVTVTTSASTSTSTTASTPRTAGTWDIISPERERERGWGNTNPWGEDRPNLHDLSLEDMKQERGSGTKAAAKQSADNDKDDKALVDAAMGGDSKAWDPLGAL